MSFLFGTLYSAHYYNAIINGLMLLCSFTADHDPHYHIWHCRKRNSALQGGQSVSLQLSATFEAEELLCLALTLSRPAVYTISSFIDPHQGVLIGSYCCCNHVYVMLGPTERERRRKRGKGGG